jgi:hypothetical protein
MEVANTLSYYITATIIAVKKFVAQDPGANHIKLLSYFLPTKIRLGWKGLPGTDTLACYENA